MTATVTRPDVSADVCSAPRHDRRQILHVALPARLHVMHRQLDHSARS